MKHIKVFEQFINEKAYRLTGAYTSKGIVGKVMQAFKKQIERVKYEGNAEDTLKMINTEWVRFSKTATDIILGEIQKVTKSMDEILFVTASLNSKWESDTINNLNTLEGPLYVGIPGDFTINIGFMDDANANKYARKLGGITNPPLKNATAVDIYGTFNPAVGGNNVEIRESEIMMVDAK
jgi:hypothetical protein